MLQRARQYCLGGGQSPPVPPDAGLLGWPGSPMRSTRPRAACTTDAELACLLEDAARELGIRYFALLHHRSLGEGASRLIRLDNYPAGWEEEMRASGLVGHDPVHLACTRCHAGFRWEVMGRLLVLDRQRDMLSRGARFGLGDGFTVPANVPGEPAGSCTFAVETGKELPVQRLHAAETIGLHAFGAARRIHHLPLPANPPRLSRRERQCLRRVARGKTDGEIAIILGISLETARQYVKGARVAWDVISLTQAVVHGPKDCVISYDDALG